MSSNWPTGYDDFVTTHTDATDREGVLAPLVNNLGRAIEKMQVEEGLNPSGAAGTIAEAILTITSRWVEGSGSPEGVQTANRGVSYFRTDGGPGTTIYLKEVGTGNTGWTAQQSATPQNPPAQNTAPVNTVAPTVTGQLEEGQTLTANNGTWTGTQPITYTYQWQFSVNNGASWANNAGYTAATYTTSSADVGYLIRVRVTATNVAGTLAVNSAGVGPITAIVVPPPQSGFPTYATAVTTAFTGANENPISEGGNWLNVPGWGDVGQRLSNALTGVGVDWWMVIWEPTVDADGLWTDIEGIIEVPTWPGSPPRLVEYYTRMTGAGNPATAITYANRTGYSLSVADANLWEIYRLDNGVVSGVLASVTFTGLASTGSVGVSSIGSRHSIWHKPAAGVWTEIAFAIDTTYSQGRIAVGGHGTSTVMDNFRVGGLHPTAPPPPPPPPAAFPNYATAVTSSFTGSNESPLSEGGNWANISGWPTGAQRLSNAVKAQTSDFWASLWKPTQAEGIMTTQEGIVLVTTADTADKTYDFQTRLLGNGGAALTYANRNGYVFLTDSLGDMWISRADNNVLTQLGATITAPTIANGDSLGWRSTGSTHEWWRKPAAGSWTLLMARTDATYPQGRIAIGGFGTTMVFDDFRVGGLVVPGAPPPSNFGSALASGWPRMPQSTGTQYYVSGSGNNGNAGTIGSPWQTISHALANVPLNGSIINVRTGTYAPGSIAWARAGSASNPVTLQAYPGEFPVVSNTRFDISGSYLRVKGLDFSGNISSGEVKIGSGGVNHIEFDSCKIHNYGNMGILGGANGVASDVQIWNCRIYSIGDLIANQNHGIYTADCNRWVIANCLIYDNYSFGLQLYPNLQNSIVTCCTIDDHPNAAPIVLGAGSVTVNNRIHACILSRSDSGSGFPAIHILNSTSFSGNSAWDCIGYLTSTPAFPEISGYTTTNCSDTSTNPLYVNQGARDYHLQAGSPAINLASARPEYVPQYDIDGTARITADAGCFAKL